VEALITRLSINESREDDVERAMKELVELGSEATPLLVPYLDPGTTPSESDKLRAERVSVALCKMDVTPGLDVLLAKLVNTSETGALNVLRVLETSSDRDRIRPKVRALFDASHGAVKRGALRTLFQLGGVDNDALVSQILLGDDDMLVRLALAALAEGRNVK